MANDLDSRLAPVQRFGKELARMRREHDLTQAALGKRLGCSSSLVAHIEKGDRTPKPDFAAGCDQVFGTGNRFARLCRSITSPSGPGWYLRWTDEIEPSARVLRSWDPLLIPGMLQTEDYARAVFRGDLAGISNQEVEDGVSARLRRQLTWTRTRRRLSGSLSTRWCFTALSGAPKSCPHRLTTSLQSPTVPP
jgi:transcriptional regulator with XRE-family HTH domain